MPTITQLPAASNLDGSELLPIVKGGLTNRISLSQVLAYLLENGVSTGGSGSAGAILTAFDGTAITASDGTVIRSSV